MSDINTVAMDSGYDAYVNGMLRTDNPYEQTSFDYQCWDGGWCLAESEYDEGFFGREEYLMYEEADW